MTPYMATPAGLSGTLIPAGLEPLRICVETGPEPHTCPRRSVSGRAVAGAARWVHGGCHMGGVPGGMGAYSRCTHGCIYRVGIWVHIRVFGHIGPY